LYYKCKENELLVVSTLILHGFRRECFEIAPLQWKGVVGTSLYMYILFSIIYYTKTSVPFHVKIGFRCNCSHAITQLFWRVHHFCMKYLVANSNLKYNHIYLMFMPYLCIIYLNFEYEIFLKCCACGLHYQNYVWYKQITILYHCNVCTWWY